MLDGEDVEEVWSNGNLVERRFARAGFTGVVRVTYEPGCTAQRCAPPRMQIVNEWFSYRLTIENGEFTWL